MLSERAICIGIVTKDRCQYLDDCLDSILAQSRLPKEVVIFNDGSRDQTEETIKSKRKRFEEASIRFTYLFSNECKGQPYGRNKIVENSMSDIIAYVDDDVICAKSWIEGIDQSYSNELVGGVGGPAIRVKHDMKTMWPEVNTNRNMNTINKCGEIRDYSDNWVPIHTVETHILRGANMSFRREVLTKVGGFDEEYFGRAVMEDVDVQIRIRNVGYKLLYNPKDVENKKDDWYSIGFTSAYFIKKHFRKYYLVTLLKMFFFL